MMGDKMKSRQYLAGSAIRKAVFLILLFACSLSSASKDETVKTLTLWQAIDAATRQLPFTKAAIEKALSVQLVERVEPSNDKYTFFRSHQILLQDGIVLASVKLSIKKENPDISALGFDIEGTCVTLENVRRQYDALTLVGAPRGGSLEEATTYSASRPWGALLFGFKERQPDCLAYVSFRPTQ